MNVFIFMLCLGSVVVAGELPSTSIPEHDVVVDLVDVPAVPNPRHNPYPACVMLLECEVVEGQVEPAAKRIVIGMMAFEDRKLAPAADLWAGDRIAVTLIPFGAAGEKIKALQRISLVEDERLPVYWAKGFETVKK